MPGLRAAKRAKVVSAAKKTKGARGASGKPNCGSGHGGFKPGNTCGKGKRQALAAQLRAARANKDTDQSSLRATARALRQHRRGKETSISNNEVKQIRKQLKEKSVLRSYHGALPHQGRVNALAGKLKEYDRSKPATLKEAHDHVDRLVTGHTKQEIHAAIEKAGMGTLTTDRKRTIQVLKSIHERSIARRQQRAVDAENAREARAGGLHRMSKEEFQSIQGKIKGRSDAELNEMESRYRRSYGQSTANGGLNFGERARFRRVLREIDAERKRRQDAAKANKPRRGRGAADRHVGPDGTITVLPKFGPSKAEFQFTSTKSWETAISRKEAEAHAEQIFGRPVKVRELASIAGAPDNATVRFEKTGHKELTIYTKSPEMESTRQIRVGSDGKPYIYNAYFVVGEQHQSKGLGYSVFGRQIEHATKAGVTRLKVSAARGGGFNGYATWAKFGYRGDIPYGSIPANLRPEIRNELPAHLHNATRVEELMPHKEGRDWWVKHGESWSGEFRLDKDSESLKFWKGYRAEKIRERAANQSRPRPTPPSSDVEFRLPGNVRA